MRGIFSGLAGFFVAGVLLAATVGPALPDGWSNDAFAAAGVFAALLAGAAAGVDGRLAGPPWTGIAGAALGALALIVAQPQADADHAGQPAGRPRRRDRGALLSPFGRRAPRARAMG